MSDTIPKAAVQAKIDEWLARGDNYSAIQYEDAAEELRALLAAPQLADAIGAEKIARLVFDAIPGILGMTPDPWPCDDIGGQDCLNYHTLCVKDVADLAEALRPLLTAPPDPPASAWRPIEKQELRYDELGQLDDVVVPHVETFRLERMDTDHWWMRLYLPSGDDLVFTILSDGEINVSVEVESSAPPADAGPQKEE